MNPLSAVPKSGSTNQARPIANLSQKRLSLSINTPVDCLHPTLLHHEQPRRKKDRRGQTSNAEYADPCCSGAHDPKGSSCGKAGSSTNCGCPTNKGGFLLYRLEHGPIGAPATHLLSGTHSLACERQCGCCVRTHQ